MCYHTSISRQGEAMRLLRIAVEKRRWDLAAHTIILATASVLKNGDKPPAGKRANNSSLRISGGTGAGKITKTGGREFERKKRGPNR
jgi:hypothetical protein